jgi:hypothetical protein
MGLSIGEMTDAIYRRLETCPNHKSEDYLREVLHTCAVLLLRTGLIRYTSISIPPTEPPSPIDKLVLSRQLAPWVSVSL